MQNSKFLTERKYPMNTLTFARWKHLWIKLENLFSQTNNDGLKAVFYRHCSNELGHVFLDVYDSWEKLGTIGVSYRTGIISAIYKKGDKTY